MGRTAKTTILSGGFSLQRRRGSADLSIVPRTPRRTRTLAGWRPARLSARKTTASARSKSDVTVAPTQQNNKKIKCPIILRRTNGILFHLCEYVYRYGFLFKDTRNEFDSYFSLNHLCLSSLLSSPCAGMRGILFKFDFIFTDLLK